MSTKHPPFASRGPHLSALAAIALATAVAACQPKGNDPGPAEPPAPATGGRTGGSKPPPPPPSKPDADTTPPVPVNDGSTPSTTPDAATTETAAPIDGGAPETGTTDSGGEDAGSGGPGTNLFVNPLGPVPQSLKDSGIFTSLPDLSKTHPRAFRFEPRHALWTNGLGKERHAVLPEGMKINTMNREVWDFPVGTLFFKTFLQDPAAPGGKARPVETRLIRRVKNTGEVRDQWEFFAYQWKEDGSDATLLTNRNFTVPVDVKIAGKAVTHNIPSTVMCRQCHIANLTPIIGFDELRLNMKVGASAKTQLQDVIDKGWLSNPPAAPHAEITDANPAQKWIREYMHGNCGHCHNGGAMVGDVRRVFDLRGKMFVENTVNKMTMERTAEGLRIAPGKPEASVVYLAFMRDTSKHPELKPMPLLGIDVIDMEAAKKLSDWIKSLPAQ